VPNIFSVACAHCHVQNNNYVTPDALKLLCGSCERQVFTGRPVDVDGAGFAKHAVAGQIPVLAMFYINHSPGRGLDIRFPDYAFKYEPHVRCVEINLEHAQDLAEALNVRHAPVLMLFKNGQPVDRWSGKPHYDIVGEWLDNHGIVARPKRP